MPRTSDGFTLIESLVALALVVSIALGSAQLFIVAIARNLSAREQLAMALLASTRIDDLSAAAADGTVALTPDDSLDRAVGGCSDTAIQAGRAYVTRWRVSRVPGFGDEAVAIAVRVMPETGTGDVRIGTIREWARP